MTLSIGSNSIHSFDSNSGPFSNSQAQDQAYDPYDPWQGENPSFGPQYQPQALAQTLAEAIGMGMGMGMAPALGTNTAIAPASGTNTAPATDLVPAPATDPVPAPAPPTDYGYNEQSKSAETNKRALEAFKDMLPDLDQAAGIGGADGKVSKKDIQAALNDTNSKLSAEDKAALNYLLNVKMNDNPHSTLFDLLDGHDGRVSKKDIEKALTRDLDPNADTMKQDNGLAYPY